jgi:hypothetical protein
MVRVISLEQALAQGETPSSITALIKWQEAALREVENPRAWAKAMSKGERKRAAARYEETILALGDLVRQIRNVATAKSA